MGWFISMAAQPDRGNLRNCTMPAKDGRSAAQGLLISYGNKNPSCIITASHPTSTATAAPFANIRRASTRPRTISRLHAVGWDKVLIVAARASPFRVPSPRLPAGCLPVPRVHRPSHSRPTTHVPCRQETLDQTCSASYWYQTSCMAGESGSSTPGPWRPNAMRCWSTASTSVRRYIFD